MTATDRPDRVIYFVMSEANGLVKIGIAADLDRRLACLKAQSSVPLRLLGRVGEVPTAWVEGDDRGDFGDFVESIGFVQGCLDGLRRSRMAIPGVALREGPASPRILPFGRHGGPPGRPSA